VLRRLVESGRLSPRALELWREWDGADDERRQQPGEQIRQEIGATQAARAARAQVVRELLDVMSATSDRGWREVKLESVTFNQRYRLRTKKPDDLEVVGIFDPVRRSVSIRRRACSGPGGEHADERRQDRDEHAAAELEHRPLKCVKATVDRVDAHVEARAQCIDAGAHGAEILVYPVEAAFHAASEVVEALIGPG
jgi:hypothetical protein